MMSPWQGSFDDIYIVICYLWLTLGVLTLRHTEAGSRYAALALELARTTYVTVVFVTLGGALLGFHTSPIAGTALAGSFITYLLFVQATDRAQGQTIHTPGLRYMHVGFGMVIVNGACSATLLMS